VNRYDAVIVGGGHNGLVAATMLARAGRRVIVLERREQVGGAAVSGSPWRGVDAHVSRYSYLVSLFPASLRALLGLNTELRARAVSSYPRASDQFTALRRRLAERLGPTLTEPLRSADDVRRLLGGEDEWILERPLSEVLESTFEDDIERGLELTDATIGTFAPADDPQLRQNRCFLYHVIGGPWKLPVGGMGALTGELEAAARQAGAEVLTNVEVTAIETDGGSAEVSCADGPRHQTRHVLANVAPAVLARLLGEAPAGDAPEGSQLKINMLLRRLPRLRDPKVTPEQAFTGTFHVNEGYEQLQGAYEQAAAGRIPSLPPCELYCHSLTDPTILSDQLRAAGAQTLTLFGLHMPARLFRAAPEAAKRAAVDATLASVDSVLAEPLTDCLWEDADGAPCLEALTPVELEAELGMPGGHIFHRDLAWPFAETDADLGTWGVETEHRNVWLCGAGARRGGGVSGIPGHNAARAVLGALGTS
jgi:phytoene dehydrogenase-like protein